MTNVARIRGFLLLVPKPAKVLITCSDGDEQELACKQRSYQKLAETIAALDPQQIKCFDAEEKLLRAKRFDDEDSRRSDAAAVPDSLKADPHAAMLTHFANLLHRAYEHSTEVAFTRLVEITDRMNERSDSIEQRLERTESANRRLLREQIDSELDRAEEQAQQRSEGGFPTELVNAFMGGMQTPQPVKTNGKAHRKED